MSGTYKTFINRGTERVRLTATLQANGDAQILWVERFVSGELTGCGPSHMFLAADTRSDVESRLASLFDGTLLWQRAEGV